MTSTNCEEESCNTTTTATTTTTMATSARASRAARPPLPSNKDSVVFTVQDLESRLQEKGLTPFTARRQRHRNGQVSYTSTNYSSGAAWRHMISIHSKSVDSLFRDQQHVAFLQGHSPRVTELIRIGIRYSSVRVSLVYQKSLKVAGAKMGSSQQTTRVNVHTVCAAWAAQSVAVMTALGCCTRSLEKHDCCCTLSDPRSSHAVSGKQMLKAPKDALFVVAATSRTPAHSLPTRLVACSLLTTMKQIATAELVEELISSSIRQQQSGDALTRICRRVVHDSSAGDSIWASLALLSYLQSEPAGRRIIQQRNISDVDAAVACTFLAYGRSEITRRSRLTDLQIATSERPISRRLENSKNRADRAEKMARIDDTIETMMHDELESDDVSSNTMNSVVGALCSSDCDAMEGEEDESSGTGSSTVVLADRPPGRPPTTMEQQERARRRIPDASTTLMIRGDQVSEEVRMVLCQKRKRGSNGSSSMMSASAMTLVYWDAALKSQHAHVLLMLLASSKSAAQKAADATVRSQVMEHDLLSNQILRQLSEENAVRSAVALRTTVMQSSDETPLLCSWRTEKSKLRIGIARSRDDLSTCTLYACRYGDLEPNEVSQTRVGWTESYYHATPSAITSPFPGVSESLDALLSHNEHVAQNAHSNLAMALKESSRIKETLRGKLTSMNLSGITRSVVCIKSSLVVPESQLTSAECLGKKLSTYWNEAREIERRSENKRTSGEVLRPLDTRSLTSKDVHEPYTTPANNLVIALEASESVRALGRGRSHCGDPAKAFFGLQRPRELAESWSQDFDRPSSLFTIVDLSMEMAGSTCSALPRLPTRLDARLVQMTTLLTLSGDSPVRAPEAIRQVSKTRAHEGRALLFVAASTASLLSETVLMSCAGALNTASAAAKRVLVADVNKRLMATPYQVYVKGDRNVRPSFTGTAWEGKK